MQRRRRLAIFTLAAALATAGAAEKPGKIDPGFTRLLDKCDLSADEKANACLDKIFEFMNGRIAAFTSRVATLGKPAPLYDALSTCRLNGRNYAEMLWENEKVKNDFEAAKRLFAGSSAKAAERLQDELERLRLEMKIQIGLALTKSMEAGTADAVGQTPWCRCFLLELSETGDRPDLRQDGQWPMREKWARKCANERLASLEAGAPEILRHEADFYGRWLTKPSDSKSTPAPSENAAESEYDRQGDFDLLEFRYISSAAQAWAKTDAFEWLMSVNQLLNAAPDSEAGLTWRARFYQWQGDWEKGCESLPSGGKLPETPASDERFLQAVRCGLFRGGSPREMRESAERLQYKGQPAGWGFSLALGMIRQKEGRSDFALGRLAEAEKAAQAIEDPFLKWDALYEIKTFEALALLKNGANAQAAEALAQAKSLAKKQAEQGPLSEYLAPSGRYQREIARMERELAEMGIAPAKQKPN